MRSETAHPPPPVRPRAAIARRAAARLVVALALLAAAACSNTDPTLESVAGPEPSGSARGVTPVTGAGAETATGTEGSTEGIDTAATAAASALDGDPVRIGVLLDTTNLMATTDRQPGVAFVTAIERIAANGDLDGRAVEVTWANTTSRMSVVDAEAAEMIDAGVDLLVVTCELDFARPAIDRAVAAGVLVVSPCGSEAEWASGALGPTAFSMVPPAEVLGASMADHAWEEGHRRVGIVVDDTAPEAGAECQGFRDRWVALGGRIGTELSVNLTSAEDLAADSARLEGLQGDALVLCSLVRVAEAVIESVRGQGLRVPIIAGPTLDTGVWVPEDFDAPLREFTLLTLASTVGDDPGDAVLDAAAEFLVADGVPPNNGRFVLGADLAAAYAAAVTRAGSTDGTAVADVLRSMVDEPLISGAVTFGGAQAPTSWALRIMRHEGGAFVNDGVVVAARPQ